MSLRPSPRPAARPDLRYLRREGNRKVRARRRRRTAARWVVMSVALAAGLAALVAAGGAAVRWSLGPGHFRLENVVVRGTREAREDEVRELVAEWSGRNLLTIALPEVEKRVRRHPWVGAGGGVRIERKLPSSLIITVGERTAGGLALLDGVVWLLDERGLPIDRYGPRYARYDFPLVKGLDGLRAEGGEERLRHALADGARVSAELAAKAPSLWKEISEIDVAREHEVVLRLEGTEHDVRLSADEPLLNLPGYLALRDEIGGDGEEAIEYVDLRWRDRIAVMPAAQHRTRNGGE
ncbi:MAG: cell division protein FtsQ/DivIB [Candidatus Polarisedimenticolia bacterium]